MTSTNKYLKNFCVGVLQVQFWNVKETEKAFERDYIFFKKYIKYLFFFRMGYDFFFSETNRWKLKQIQSALRFTQVFGLLKRPYDQIRRDFLKESGRAVSDLLEGKSVIF